MGIYHLNITLTKNLQKYSNLSNLQDHRVTEVLMENQERQAPRVDPVTLGDQDHKVSGVSVDHPDNQERMVPQVFLVTPEDPDHKDQLETEVNKDPSDLEDNPVPTVNPYVALFQLKLLLFWASP